MTSPAAPARLSFSSDTTVASRNNGPPATAPPRTGSLRSRHTISSVLSDPSAPASLLPSFPSLASNAYLPASISSLSTSFTSAGTMPKASGKSIAQRRSQAPPVVVSDTRKVLKSEFEPYLQEVTGEWERWERERKLGRRGTADLGSQMEERRDSLSAGLGLGIAGAESDLEDGPISREEEQLPPLDAVPQIFFDPTFNLSNPRTFDLVTEKILPTPSSSPTLTRRTLPRPPSSLTPRPGLGPLTLAALASDQMLQEKLSHYTAVVESHLVREIGLRSSSFFSALTNLQDLHQQGEQCLGKIGELHAALSSDPLAAGKGVGVGGAAKRGLGILRAQARRRGMEQLERGVREIEEVHQGIEGVRDLVENGEWMGALEVSEGVEALYYGRTPTPDTEASSSASSSRINLTRIDALKTVPARLAALRAQVGRSLELEMMGVLDREMELGVGEYMKSISGGGWKGKGKASPLEITLFVTTSDEARVAGEETVRERALERISPVVRGLVRADGMESAVAAWREAVLRDIRSMVREHLPTQDQQTAFEDEDTFGNSPLPGADVSEKSLALAKNLRALSHDAFVVLARDTYAGLLGCIEVVEIHSKVLLELAVAMREEERVRKSIPLDPTEPVVADAPLAHGKSNGVSSSLRVPDAPDDLATLALTTFDSKLPALPLVDNAALASDLADVVHAAAELANIRFSKVIAVRSELHATSSLAEFLEIFDVSWAFVLSCEIICRRMIVGLRGVMVAQAKAFLQNFHQSKISEGARVVENEQWVVAEVKPKAQDVINLILTCAVSDPPELLLGKRKKAVTNGTTQAVDGVARDPAKQVDIEGREYFAVAAGLRAVEVLADYLKVVLNFPLLTTDAMSKVVEYMKSFNSRTCQVVLGAGAMRSAGLKNITAKHLALASQALSIMISLIPYVRETLRRHLNPKQAVMLVEFDKLKRDFQEHQNEIHSKLVAIMSDRMQIHSKSLQAINWEVAVPARAASLPNLYMETLVKEHVTLHKVLSRFLQGPTVEFIMLQVLVALNLRLAEEYGRIEIKSEDARERLARDVAYMTEKLRELKGLENGKPAAGLVEMIAAKALPVAAAPATPRASIDLPTPTTPTTPRPYISRRAESSPGRNSPITARATPQLPPIPPPEVLPTPSLVVTEPVLGPVPDALPALPSIVEAASVPLPATPVEELPPMLPLPFPLTPASAPAPAPADPPRRRSMAERLSELARRGSGDLAPPPPPAALKPSPLPPLEETLATVKETVEELIVPSVVVEEPLSIIVVPLPQSLIQEELAVDQSPVLPAAEAAPVLEDVPSELDTEETGPLVGEQEEGTVKQDTVVVDEMAMAEAILADESSLPSDEASPDEPSLSEQSVE